MLSLIKKHPIITFVLAVLLPVHGILWPLRLSGVPIESLKGFKILFALIPSIAAFIITFIAEGEESVTKLWRRVFLKRGAIKYYLLALFSLFLIGVLSLLIRYGYDGFLPNSNEFPTIGNVILLGIFLLLFPGFTEEFGWRGFLQHRLQKRTGVWLASLLTGLVWGSWHGMDFLMGNFPGGIFNVSVFFAYIVGTSILIGAMYTASKGSVAVAILAHFSANAVSSFLPVWSESAGQTTPLIFVGGIWLVAIILLISNFSRRKPEELMES